MSAGSGVLGVAFCLRWRPVGPLALPALSRRRPQPVAPADGWKGASR
jgi:hypothetical protein